MLVYLAGPLFSQAERAFLGSCARELRAAGLERGEPWRKGILALATDDRLRRRNASLEHGGLNLFLGGLIERAGGLFWSLDDAKARLLAWKREL
jgi:hypothetical protein